MSMWTGASDELTNYLAQREVERQRELVNAFQMQDRARQQQRDSATDRQTAIENKRADAAAKRADETEKRIAEVQQAQLSAAAKDDRYRTASTLRTTLQPGAIAPQQFDTLAEFGLDQGVAKKTPGLALRVAVPSRPGEQPGDLPSLAHERQLPNLTPDQFESLGGTEYQQKQRDQAAATERAREATKAADERAADQRASTAAIAAAGRENSAAIAAAGRQARDANRGNLSATAEGNLLRQVGNDWARASKGLTEARTYAAHIATGLQQYDQNPIAAQDAVIYAYNKILDPNSVVRESEYARTAEGQSLLAKLEGLKQQYLSVKGGRIPKETLQQLANVAGNLVQNVEAATLPARHRATQILDRYNLPPELVFDAPPPAATTTPAQAVTPAPGGQAAPPAGATTVGRFQVKVK